MKRIPASACRYWVSFYGCCCRYSVIGQGQVSEEQYLQVRRTAFPNLHNMYRRQSLPPVVDGDNKPKPRSRLPAECLGEGLLRLDSSSAHRKQAYDYSRERKGRNNPATAYTSGRVGSRSRNHYDFKPRPAFLGMQMQFPPTPLVCDLKAQSVRDSARNLWLNSRVRGELKPRTVVLKMQMGVGSLHPAAPFG